AMSRRRNWSISAGVQFCAEICRAACRISSFLDFCESFIERSVVAEPGACLASLVPSRSLMMRWLTPGCFLLRLLLLHRDCFLFGSIGGKASQQTVILLHVFVVFRQRGAKKMAALGVGHEVEVIRLGWSQGRAQGYVARIADRPRRQTTVRVCVVW